ncbi:PcfJ domain-containing protein [Phragmitibacter flavus]|uniref:PcfJ domain-containing protein n=1 Tax=Phragmitibacter flavus TaxID=2576071 RepID=UPI001409338C|nr:PcfJ domain-containing protein [Phragmitibacter flavus]
MTLINDTDLFTTSHPDEYPCITVQVRVAAYSKHWIRQPEDWIPRPNSSASPKEQIQHLLEHLFVLWPVPEYLHSAWLVNGDLVYLERDWYCLLGSGASLRNLPGMPPSISSRALHLSQTAPAHLTIRQALRWGQVKAMNGSESLIHAVLSSRMVYDFSNDVIWSRLVEKFSVSLELPPNDFGIISDTLLEVLDKHGLKRAKTLVDRPLKELLCFSQKYWRSFITSIRASLPDFKIDDVNRPSYRAELRYLGASTWPLITGSTPAELITHHGGRTRHWKMQELNSHAQLIAESQTLRHCVHAYGGCCKAGHSAIFSLQSYDIIKEQKYESHHLTIEVDPQTRKVVQVRGKWNRIHDSKKLSALQIFAEQLDLVL